MLLSPRLALSTDWLQEICIWEKDALLFSRSVQLIFLL